MKPYFIDKSSALHFDIENPKELVHLRPYRTLLAIAGDWLVIAASMAWAVHTTNPLVWLLCAFICGSRQHALAIIVHDVGHGLFFHSRKLGDRVANILICYPMLFSMETYRRTHLAHHLYTNDPEKDPNFVIQAKSAEFMGLKSRRDLFWLLFKDFFLINIAGQLQRLVRVNKNKSAAAEKSQGRKRGAFLFSALFFIALYLISPYALLFWILTLAGPFSMFLRLRSIGDHWGLYYNRNDLQATRNFSIGKGLDSWFERLFFCPHNINYHLDHHLYMQVPFYNLPKLHQELMKHPVYQEQAAEAHSLLFRGSVLSGARLAAP